MTITSNKLIWGIGNECIAREAEICCTIFEVIQRIWWINDYVVYIIALRDGQVMCVYRCSSKLLFGSQNTGDNVQMKYVDF